ncbi:MAG: hypothetical protein AVDCRST_MAG59-2996, partial [uncultured Thermomicrobiales bacterium]
DHHRHRRRRGAACRHQGFLARAPGRSGPAVGQRRHPARSRLARRLQPAVRPRRPRARAAGAGRRS